LADVIAGPHALYGHPLKLPGISFPLHLWFLSRKLCPSPVCQFKGSLHYFFWQREATGFAFCGFWFFENFPYIGTYMADARAQALPLVGSGEHDWEILFGQWGLLAQDQKIGGIMRTLGWLGMLATMAWLAYRVRHDAPSKQ
ncbi:MAG TPA: hypothetical protein VHF01_08975, partial [Candidatus Acidoferrum sp.]|nr:hypothetical protein [Candidatus Acidoferrum sp.]